MKKLWVALGSILSAFALSCAPVEHVYRLTYTFEPKLATQKDTLVQVAMVPHPEGVDVAVNNLSSEPVKVLLDDIVILKPDKTVAKAVPGEVSFGKALQGYISLGSVLVPPGYTWAESFYPQEGAHRLWKAEEEKYLVELGFAKTWGVFLPAIYRGSPKEFAQKAKSKEVGIVLPLMVGDSVRYYTLTSQIAEVKYYRTSQEEQSGQAQAKQAILVLGTLGLLAFLLSYR